MKKPFEILLVEDNQGDIMLTKEAFIEVGYLHELNVVCDGEGAIKYITKQENYSDAITPDLILLDINIPLLNGLEVLKIIKGNSKFSTIPVIMLTTSESKNHIQDSYMSHANCYLVKNANFDDFIKVVGTIKNFWIDQVTFC